MATELQKRAAKLAIENAKAIKPLTKGEILLKAGYSPETAKNAHLIYETIGFQTLIDEAFPDELLAKIHREGLEAMKFIPATEFQEQTVVDDHPTRHKFLESAYKLKGKLKDGVENKTLILNINGETAKRYGLSPDTISSSES